MAKEYIERDIAIEKTETFCDVFVTQWTDEKVLAWIRNLPAADVVEVKHGRWKLHDDGSGTCDQCGFTQKHIWDDDNWQNYCGVCGADMRELNGSITNMSPATKKLYDDVMESLTREGGDNNAQTD